MPAYPEDHTLGTHVEGCHRRETKLVRPCGETRWLHASSPRIITGRSSKNRLPFWSWLAATARTPAPFMDPALQIGDGTPFSIRAEWSKARRRGHSGLTQRTSAVYAIWWWWYLSLIMQCTEKSIELTKNWNNKLGQKAEKCEIHKWFQTFAHHFNKHKGLGLRPVATLLCFCFYSTNNSWPTCFCGRRLVHVKN